MREFQIGVDEGARGVPAGRFWVEGYEAVLDGKFATHDPSPQTMGLAGVFEFAKNSWQEAESRSTLSIAGYPQGARCLPCCHRAACASEASWPRVTAMEADAGGAGWEACQMDCIPPSASALFLSAFHLQPAS